MNTNENELREDLGTFGGAVKNGWLKDNFWVEEAILTKTASGRICLKCHMGRWFGKDDELLLFPDGTGKNLDITAEDRNFKWKSIEVRSTSFAKSILIGAGIGAATGAGAGWAVGKFGGGAAVASTTMPKAIQAAGSTATKALPAAGSVAGSEAVQSITTAARGAGLEYGNIAKLGLKLQNGASRQDLIGMCRKWNYNPKQQEVALDLASKWVKAGGSALHERKNKKNVVNEEVNEVAPQAVGALIGTGVGAIGGGIYALVKNRDNVRYYSDGTYKSKKGTLEGRWDGKVEKVAKEEAKKEEVKKQKTNTTKKQNKKQNIPNERVRRMQHALNAAGYNSGKEDGLLGPTTRAAAKEAGIDPDTWNGTPEIKPKQQGVEQAAQQSVYDYTKSYAYGKYLGGATPEEIQKFQYDFKVQPTGKYDEATAEKAYALANDEADNNFKRAGSTIKAYANYDLHQSGYASGQADLKAQQAREALVAQVEKLKKRLAPIDDRKLDQIISYADSGNFAAATELAKRVSGGGHTIQPLIAALEAARKPAMNEMKEKFFETLNRINNATILL